MPRIAELTDIGEVGSSTFSIETAISARPDVAILAQWQYTGLGDAVAKLEAAGIPVVVADYNAQTVEKHVASTLLIGAVMGTEARARKLADEYAAAVADVEARVAKAGGAPKRVYVELGKQGAAEVGNSYGDTMWGGVVRLAGGHNIALGQISKWGPLSPEYVLASDPEVVFIAGSGWAGRDTAVLMGPGIDAGVTQARLKPYTERPGWETMTAVKDGAVHALYHGGARTLYDYAFLQYIAKALHPEAFADVDPQAALERFFGTYLPIEAKGPACPDGAGRGLAAPSPELRTRTDGDDLQGTAGPPARLARAGRGRACSRGGGRHPDRSGVPRRGRGGRRPHRAGIGRANGRGHRPRDPAADDPDGRACRHGAGDRRQAYAGDPRQPAGEPLHARLLRRRRVRRRDGDPNWVRAPRPPDPDHPARRLRHVGRRGGLGLWLLPAARHDRRGDGPSRDRHPVPVPVVAVDGAVSRRAGSAAGDRVLAVRLAAEGELDQSRSPPRSSWSAS